jgi:hypothetical protein
MAVPLSLGCRGYMPNERDTVFFASLKNSLPAELASHVVFETDQAGMEALKACLERAAIEVGRVARNAGGLVVVGQNAARVASFAKEVRGTGNDDASTCLGIIGAEAARSRVKASVVANNCGCPANLSWVPLIRYGFGVPSSN